MSQSIPEIQEKLAPVFRAYGVSRATLFGSFAKGTATGASDLDLLVDSRLRGLKFVGLMEAMRSAIQMPVDMFDVSHIETGSRLAQEIYATGVTIYEE